MSLRAKIALGVIAATAILAVALALLGLQAWDEFEITAERQRSAQQAEMLKRNEEFRTSAVRAIEKLVLGQLEPILYTDHLTLPERLREDTNGIDETGIITRDENDNLELQVVKPAGSRMGLSADEQAVARRVFETGRHEVHDKVMFVPHNPEGTERLRRLLRLKLDIPDSPTSTELPDPPKAELGGIVAAAFTTLALAMLAVFVLLMFALRKFVLAPLGNVLEDSERIVKGVEGLTVKGFKGGKGKDIETLVAAFNAMFSELKDYQSDLEGKVKNATRTIKQQQQSLVIAQRLAATGTLAAGLAHEVNNPLSGMLNAARRLKKKEGLDERARDYIELIEEGLSRIENLMKQILDFSRRRDMKPERFSGEDAFKRALQLVRIRLDSKKLRLEEDIRKDLPEIYGNKEEIGQVLMNLLINAADASPDESSVRVTIQTGPLGGAMFAIEDSGEGIPDEIRDRIFDPFFTTKEPGKGTGLGLAIVHTIVDNHGGSVRAEKGQTLGGAKFVVELPPPDIHESQRLKEV